MWAGSVRFGRGIVIRRFLLNRFDRGQAVTAALPFLVAGAVARS
jgi:hypothetical protein